VKPTKISSLIAYVAAVTMVGFVVIQQIVDRGMPAPSAGVSILIVVPVLALYLFVRSYAMIRYRRAMKKFLEEKGKRPSPVDSKYAVSTVVLAKSMSITGSILLGWHLSILWFRLSVSQPTGILPVSLACLESLALAIVGVIVENLFRVPPDSDNEAA